VQRKEKEGGGGSEEQIGAANLQLGNGAPFSIEAAGLHRDIYIFGGVDTADEQGAEHSCGGFQFDFGTEIFQFSASSCLQDVLGPINKDEYVAVEEAELDGKQLRQAQFLQAGEEVIEARCGDERNKGEHCNDEFTEDGEASHPAGRGLPDERAEGGGEGSPVIEGTTQGEDKNKGADHQYMLQGEPDRDFSQDENSERADGVTDEDGRRGRGQGNNDGGEDEDGNKFNSAIQPMDAGILISEFIYMSVVHLSSLVARASYPVRGIETIL
jgi:hypothetical protein